MYLSKSINWTIYELLLKLMKINGILSKVLKFISSNKLNSKKKNFKFSSLNYNNINLKVKNIHNILGLTKNIKCKLLSDRTILIKKDTNKD